MVKICNSSYLIDKPKSQSKDQATNLKSLIQKVNREFGLWAVSKILWATTHPHHTTTPITFKHDDVLYIRKENQRVKVKNKDPL